MRSLSFLLLSIAACVPAVAAQDLTLNPRYTPFQSGWTPLTPTYPSEPIQSNPIISIPYSNPVIGSSPYLVPLQQQSPVSLDLPMQQQQQQISANSEADFNTQAVSRPARMFEREHELKREDREGREERELKEREGPLGLYVTTEGPLRVFRIRGTPGKPLEFSYTLLQKPSPFSSRQQLMKQLNELGKVKGLKEIAIEREIKIKFEKEKKEKKKEYEKEKKEEEEEEELEELERLLKEKKGMKKKHHEKKGYKEYKKGEKKYYKSLRYPHVKEEEEEEEEEEMKKYRKHGREHKKVKGIKKYTPLKFKSGAPIKLVPGLELPEEEEKRERELREEGEFKGEEGKEKFKGEEQGKEMKKYHAGESSKKSKRYGAGKVKRLRVALIDPEELEYLREMERMELERKREMEEKGENEEEEEEEFPYYRRRCPFGRRGCPYRRFLRSRRQYV